MKAFAELATIKYIIAHAFYGEYDFKHQDTYLYCDNGSQIAIAYLDGAQFIQVLIPVNLVEQYLESDINKEFPVLNFDEDKHGNLNAYIEDIDLDDIKFIEMFDQWANKR
ncbi:MAG: hypothetical protein DRQ62_08090 [Gammaproteobacteria bacterium]|nr:MAG: hypothetical protein DRQ62_08090 [Gammaproteobacteria bacterium]